MPRARSRTLRGQAGARTRRLCERAARLKDSQRRKPGGLLTHDGPVVAVAKNVCEQCAAACYRGAPDLGGRISDVRFAPRIGCVAGSYAGKGGGLKQIRAVGIVGTKPGRGYRV